MHSSLGTQQIYGVVKAEVTAIPSAAVKGAFVTHDTTATATAAARFSGDKQYKHSHPNALCITSAVTSNLNELCTLAFDRSNNPTGTCGWNGSTIVAMDSDKMPADGKLKLCSEVKNSREACLPTGTVAIACGSDSASGGINVGGGNYQMVPSWIAVPQSEADLLMGQYESCYAGKPGVDNKKYEYTKTTNYSVAFSNPMNAIGRS